MIIECKRYKEIKKGTFIGYADLTLSEIGIEVFGCTLHQKDEKRWVNLPSRSYKDLTGIDKHAPIVRFSDPTKFREFCVDAKKSIDSYITKEAYNVKN